MRRNLLGRKTRFARPKSRFAPHFWSIYPPSFANLQKRILRWGCQKRPSSHWEYSAPTSLSTHPIPRDPRFEKHEKPKEWFYKEKGAVNPPRRFKRDSVTGGSDSTLQGQKGQFEPPQIAICGGDSRLSPHGESELSEVVGCGTWRGRPLASAYHRQDGKSRRPHWAWTGDEWARGPCRSSREFPRREGC